MELKCPKCEKYVITKTNTRDDIPDDVYRCPICAIPMTPLSEETVFAFNSTGIKKAAIVYYSDFAGIIQSIIEGKRVHKLEWKDRRYYGIMVDGRLMFHKPDGKFYAWVVSDGDLLGQDWIVLDGDEESD